MADHAEELGLSELGAVTDGGRIALDSKPVPRIQSAPGRVTSQKAGHILVVDDDDLVGETVVMMLHSAGYTTEWVTSGFEALQSFDRQKFDLVITDLCMPVMSGWDIISEIRARALTLPVFVMTGYVDEFMAERKNKLDELKISEILLKPIRMKDLISRMAVHVPRAATGDAPTL